MFRPIGFGVDESISFLKRQQFVKVNSCPVPIIKRYLFQDFLLVALFVSDKWSFIPYSYNHDRC